MTSPALTIDSRFTDPATVCATPVQDIGSFFGRVFTVIGDGVSDVGNGVWKGAQVALKAFADIRKDPNCFARGLGLIVYAFSAVQLLTGNPAIFKVVSDRLLTMCGMIDEFQLFDAIGYFGTGKWKEGSVYQVLGQAAMFAASVGGVALFLEKMTLINLSKIGAAIGSIPVFGAVTQLGVSLGTGVLGAVAIGFTFFGADAIRRIVQGGTPQEEMKAWLDLAWCASEVGFKVAVIAGLTNSVGLIACGTVSAGLGITAYLYGLSVK